MKKLCLTQIPIPARKCKRLLNKSAFAPVMAGRSVAVSAPVPRYVFVGASVSASPVGRV